MANGSWEMEHCDVPSRRHQPIVAAVVSLIVVVLLIVVTAGCSSKEATTKPSETAKPEYGTQVDLITGLT
jgi:hypothetical protein